MAFLLSRGARPGDGGRRTSDKESDANRDELNRNRYLPLAQVKQPIAFPQGLALYPPKIG